MNWMRLAVFVPIFIVLLKFVGFDRFERRGSPARVFFCLMLALLVVGAIEWLANWACGWRLD
jgi:hypothetical protein